MAEVGTFYQSQYTGEQLDNILKNVYDAVPLDGSKPMTAPLTIKEVENGYTQLEKNHTQTTDLGTALRDVSKGGSVVALLLKAADQAARLQFGTSVYDLIHTGNIQPYVKPFADAAEAASEEAAAALAGVRDAINNIPEGAATPIVNDLTTGGTSMALSAEMGKVLKSELDTRVNPNLLDNWYFGNPVNQRGQTEYSGTGYNIDRWQSNSSNVTKSIVEDGVKLTAKASTYGWLFWQILKVPSDAVGQSVTGCLLAADIVGTAWRFSVSFRNDADAEITSGTYDATDLVTLSSKKIPQGTVYIRVGAYVSSGARLAAGDTITLRAAKLELGTEQTLAHQDADGNWVLNEIPDYNEQLLRCCMSTADSSDTYANNKQTYAAVNAINGTVEDISGKDLANYVNLGKSGFYRGSNVTNAPTTDWYYFTIIAGSALYSTVKAQALFTDAVYEARYGSGTNGFDWGKTATTDYAVNKADGLFTSVQLMLNNQKVRLVDNGGAQLETLDIANDFTNRRSIVVRNATAQPNLSGAVIFNNIVDGVAKTYNVLHTGNKPSGSYTGNGSAAARTIDVGGIGNACIIWCGANNSFAIATSYGGGLFKTYSELGVLISTECSFINGVLTIASTNLALNYNGLLYGYQVL